MLAASPPARIAEIRRPARSLFLQVRRSSALRKLYSHPQIRPPASSTAQVFLTYKCADLGCEHGHGEVQRRHELCCIRFRPELTIPSRSPPPRQSPLRPPQSAGTKRHIHCCHNPGAGRWPWSHRHRTIHCKRDQVGSAGDPERWPSAGHDYFASVRHGAIAAPIQATPIMKVPLLHFRKTSRPAPISTFHSHRPPSTSALPVRPEQPC